MVVEQVKALAVKSDELSSIPGAHMEIELTLTRCLQPPKVCCVKHSLTGTQTHRHTHIKTAQLQGVNCPETSLVPRR